MIDRTSRWLVPEFEDARYEAVYEEFNGANRFSPTWVSLALAAVTATS